MATSIRAASWLRPVCCLSKCSRGLATVSNVSSAQQWPQRQPLGEYYKGILNKPSPYPFDEKPEEPPNSADPKVLPASKKPVVLKSGREQQADASTTSSDAPNTIEKSSPIFDSPPKTPEEAARRIFGSRLYGEEEKAKHAAAKQALSTKMGDVLIPPRPDEPDNCCMSGCVNCVWDRYREDMEEWSSKVKEAEASLTKSAAPDPGSKDIKEQREKLPKVSEEESKSTNVWNEDAFQSVPLGIREFMKLEKQLKDKHSHDHTTSS